MSQTANPRGISTVSYFYLFEFVGKSFEPEAQ